MRNTPTHPAASSRSRNRDIPRLDAPGACAVYDGHLHLGTIVERHRRALCLRRSRQADRQLQLARRGHERASERRHRPREASEHYPDTSPIRY